MREQQLAIAVEMVVPIEVVDLVNRNFTEQVLKRHTNEPNSVAEEIRSATALDDDLLIALLRKGNVEQNQRRPMTAGHFDHFLQKMILVFAQWICIELEMSGRLRFVHELSGRYRRRSDGAR